MASELGEIYKVFSQVPDLSRNQILVRAIAEKKRRSEEALRLYRPMPGPQEAFHYSAASERILRGGNRSGKSVAGFAETASAATGIPLTDSQEKPIPYRYPVSEPKTIWVIGYDQGHIGRVIYKNLFEGGAFYIIRDEQTGEWRCWKPWNEYDQAYEEKRRPAPPFIPPRLIKSMSWEDKSNRVFKCCKLIDGTEIHAFSSKSDPAQGVKVHLVHIDEDIEYPKHISEWQARMADVKGRLIWTAFPHSNNNALQDLCERAQDEKDAGKEDPDIEEFQLVFSKNPYIDDDEKRKMLLRWSKAGVEEVRARDLGEFANENVYVYPNFSKTLHSVFRERVEERDEIDRILRQTNGMPPSNWTRYLSLDPGHTICAVLFAAVPPPDLGEYLILYDELYLRRASADDVAKAVYHKAAGWYFQEFLIDYNAGRRTVEGFGINIRAQYSKAFAKQGIVSAVTGSSFTYGMNDVSAGIFLVRSALDDRAFFGPRIRIVMHNCPNLIREFMRYKKRVVRDEVREEPVQKDNHLMDALRYLVARDPDYVRPGTASECLSPARRAFLEWCKLEDTGPEEDYVWLGPGPARPVPV